MDWNHARENATGFSGEEPATLAWVNVFFFWKCERERELRVGELGSGLGASMMARLDLAQNQRTVQQGTGQGDLQHLSGQEQSQVEVRFTQSSFSIFSLLLIGCRHSAVHGLLRQVAGVKLRRAGVPAGVVHNAAFLQPGQHLAPDPHTTG